MKILKEGYSSYGHCWVSCEGPAMYFVYTMDGQSKNGPFSTFAGAMEFYGHYCT